MLKVQFTRDKKADRFVALEMKGHAEAGQAGEDIICAAMSILSFALVNNIERMTGIVPAVKTDEEAGYLWLHLADDLAQDDEEVIQTLFWHTFLAMRDDVAALNPDFVQVELVLK